MAIESEQVAFILQLVILAMVLYLLVTHDSSRNGGNKKEVGPEQRETLVMGPNDEETTSLEY